MAKAIEETLKKCKTCNKQTKHMRNTTSTGFVMALIHIVLTVATVGGWLVLLVIWKILNMRVGGGGWACDECGNT